MIVAISTSSARASVALLGADGGVLASASREAPRQSGGACLEMLQVLMGEAGVGLGDASLFVADVGPGSFTGVKVGVTLAKVLAFANGVPVAGVSSFDLIDPARVVALPSKRGETWVRVPGSVATVLAGPAPDGAVGFGPGISSEVWPDAALADSLRSHWEPCAAEVFVPEYGREPSISVPKVPYGAHGL